MEILEARVIQKVGTEAEWLANTLPLLDGEAAIVRTGDGTPVNLKFGDGGKTFAELPYFIDYSQAAYIAYEATPTQPIAYTFVGEGTYGAITVAEGYMAVLGWDGTSWSKNAEMELPSLIVEDNLNDSDVSSSLSANQGRFVGNQLIKSQNEIFYSKEQDNVGVILSSSILSDGSIVSATSSYSIEKYEVKKSDKFYIKSKLLFAATANYATVMFKVDGGDSGQGTPYGIVTNGTASETEINTTYTADKDGYLFITQWQNNPVSIKKVIDFSQVKYTNNEVYSINKEVFNLSTEDSVIEENIASTSISENGVLVSASASYSVDKVKVSKNDIINIKGESTSVTNAAVSIAMFKETKNPYGNGKSLKVIPVGVPAETVTDEYFLMEEDGYLFVIQWVNRPFTISKVTGKTSRIDPLEAELSLVDSEVFQDITTPQENTGELASSIINGTGVITGVPTASYYVERYPVQEGDVIVIEGTSIASTNAIWSRLMFKETNELSGSGDFLLTTTIGMPIGSETNFKYTVPENGFLFVTQWLNWLAKVSKVTGKSSSIKTLDSKVNTLIGDASDRLPIVTDNPLETIRYNAGFSSIFHEWGFIGDSLTSGQHEYFEAGVKKYVNLYDLSWGQQLCRASGTTGYNFSIGGQTAKGWNTNTIGPSERSWSGAETNIKKSYIISMGYNDRNNWVAETPGSYPVGDIATDIDINDYNNNADTYAGHLAGIIQRIKSVQPRAKIFLITLQAPYNPDTSNVDLWNEVIRGMADVFDNVFIIDFYKYGVYRSPEFVNNYFMGNHMTAAGYLYYSYMIMTYIDWIVRNNQLTFAEEGFVGTNYHYY